MASKYIRVIFTDFQFRIIKTIVAQTKINALNNKKMQKRINAQTDQNMRIDDVAIPESTTDYARNAINYYTDMLHGFPEGEGKWSELIELQKSEKNIDKPK